MEKRGMIRRRLLAAEAAAAVVIISILVVRLCPDLARSNGGSLSASMAPEVFFAKNSSYGSELLHARDSCGDPGTAHADTEERYDRELARKNSGVVSRGCDKKLRIVVPQKPGFKAFVNITHPITETQMVTGYSIEIFEEAMKMLQPRQDYEVYAFYGSYDELVRNVSLKEFDAAVGDVTITPERIRDADFTMPYVKMATDTYPMGIGHPYLLPPSQNLFHRVTRESRRRSEATVGDTAVTVDRSGNTTVDLTVKNIDCGLPCSSLAPALNDSKAPIQWIFLKPLTKELWLATVCFVFFTAFVFCMIERSISPEFQGSSLTQFSTALYFVLSTLTFSQGQILRSPLSKIVLVVWCLAVLLLVQSYVANLSSLLVAEASADNGSSSVAGSAPLTLRSFYTLFVVTGCISALMLLISLTRSAYASYTRLRGSESQSTLQNDAANGSVVPEQPVQEVREDNDSQGAHASSAISRDEEAGGAMQDIMSNASEPATDVYVQIEMTSTSNGVGGAL